MTLHYKAHADRVDAWLAASATGLGSDQLAALFEAAIEALWKSARRSMSDVTLVAVMDRVLFSNSSSHPIASRLSVASKGVNFEDFRKECAKQPREVVLATARSVIIEFVSILGNITADVLTPSLHLSLAKISFIKREKK